MKKDIVKNAVICLSHLEIKDTTYKIARDIVIEEYEQQKIKIKELQNEIINQDKYIDKLKNEYSKEIERLNKGLEYIELYWSNREEYEKNKLLRQIRDKDTSIEWLERAIEEEKKRERLH